MVSGSPASRRCAVWGSGAPSEVRSGGMPQRSIEAPAPRPAGAVRIGTAAAKPSSTNASTVRRRWLAGGVCWSAARLSVMSLWSYGVAERVGEAFGETLIDFRRELRPPLGGDLGEAEDTMFGPIFHHLEPPEE